MGKEARIQEQIRSILLTNKQALTIVNPWDDYITPTLQVASELVFKQNKVNRVIIVASKYEIEHEWIGHLRRGSSDYNSCYALALGKGKNKISAFFSGKRVILTNDESLSWLKDIKINRNDLLIIDEISRYRYYKSERYQVIKAISMITSRTFAFSRLPIPHGLSEIWDEMFIIDGGLRLGTSKAAFLDRYFFVNRIWVNGYIKKYIIPKGNTSEAIGRAISDVLFDLTDPGVEGGVRRCNIFVPLSSSELSRYNLMIREMVINPPGNSVIDERDIPIVAGKLLQLASGTIYDENKEVIHFHERKIQALKRLIEELGSQNVLVAYWFKHEADHILDNIPSARIIDDAQDIEDWNEGQIKVGLINSSAAGKRGDLNKGGRIIIWFSLTWSLNLYSRTNERITGNRGEMVIMHLITSETIDEAVMKILDSHKKDSRLLSDAIRKGAK